MAAPRATSKRHGGAQFITLEGGEGTGKSTQVARLADALRRGGIDVVTTREPGGAPGADEIRTLLVEGDGDRWQPLTEALLHFAARREHLSHTVWPALAAGQWVISDRFADSTMAYQGYAQGLGRAAVARLYEIAVGDFAPDLTIVLDLDAETGLARAGARDSAGGDAGTGGETRYERMGRAFHESIRAAFLDIAARDPERCVVIDAGATVDAVAASVFAVVKARLVEQGTEDRRQKSEDR